MTRPPFLTERVTRRHLAWVEARLSARDRDIVALVARLGLVTGEQIEQVCFAGLATGRSRAVSRARVLGRLVVWRVLAPLPRRVGGPQRGSARACYALDVVGAWLVRRSANGPRARRPVAVSERLVAHATTVAQVYVALTVATRTGPLKLRTFEVEPRWPDGRGGVLAPDAFVVVTGPRTEYSAWCEIDMGTESAATLRRKLAAYLAFALDGQTGPHGVVPRVIIVTTNGRREAMVRQLIAGLPEPADRLFAVVDIDDAVRILIPERENSPPKTSEKRRRMKGN